MSATTEKLYPLRLAKKLSSGLTGTPVKVTNVRYHVSSTYTAGDGYATLAEAAQAAQATIQQFDFLDGDTGRPAQSRAFVDLRAEIHYAERGSTDCVLERIEVFV